MSNTIQQPGGNINEPLLWVKHDNCWVTMKAHIAMQLNEQAGGIYVVPPVPKGAIKFPVILHPSDAAFIYAQDHHIKSLTNSGTNYTPPKKKHKKRK